MLVQDPSAQPSVRGTKDLNPKDRTDSTMEDVETYRNLFAEILVLGSTLQGLEGEDQAKFERRAAAHLPVSTTLDSGASEKHGSAGMEGVEGQKTWGQTVDGLKGLSRIMYRQHAKKLKRTYSVA